jgi:phosphoribosylformylglycinamidine cyclo-ligase
MALVGGETAEMPGIYQPGDFDLAGTIVGIAEKSEIINGSKIKAGDALIGIPSTGLHTNGYSLARKICFEIRGFKINDYIEELGCTIGEELLKVHRSYLKVFDALKQNVRIKGLSHITGGGIIGNTKRIIPDGLELDIDWQAWEWLPIFRLLQEWGGIAEEEMRKVFNLGVGLIVIVEKSGLEKSMTIMRNLGEQPVLMGRVI